MSPLTEPTGRLSGRSARQGLYHPRPAGVKGRRPSQPHAQAGGAEAGIVTKAEQGTQRIAEERGASVRATAEVGVYAV